MGSRELYSGGGGNEQLPEAAIVEEVVDGFVGILRQLGDLAQYASSYILLTKRVHWRANVLLKQWLVAGGKNSNSNMPSFIFESIERCRGPPKLFLLDKFDADGEGACLRRYTNPSFFRSDSACSTNPIHQSIQSAKTSPKANGNTRPQIHKFQNEVSSELKISSNHSPESTIKVTEDITVSTCASTDSIGEERNSDLERTSSFEEWLSPNAHNLQHDQIAEEISHYTCNNGFVSHVTTNDTIGATDNANCKEDSNTYKKAVSKRSKYKGGMEFIASRVSSFPRKLFTRKQDPQPLTVADSFRNMTTKILELKCNSTLINDFGEFGSKSREDRHDGKRLEISHPVNLASPSLQEELIPPGESDKPSSPEDMPALAEVVSDEKNTKYTQNQFDDLCEASYDTLLDEELHQSIAHQEQNDSSISKLCSTTNINTQEDCGDPTLGKACSEGPRKDMVPPLPPMQWLSSIKVHPGSRVATPKLKKLRPQSPAVNHEAVSNYVHPVKEQRETGIIQARSHFSILSSDAEIVQTSASDVKSLADISNSDGIPEKDSEEIHHQEKEVVQPSDCKIPKTMEVCEPTEHSDEARPELAEIKLDPYEAAQSHRDEIHQTCNGDSDCNKKPSESFRQSLSNEKKDSATHRNGPRADNSLDHPTDEEHNTSVHPESVFFSAVQQLTKMNPPPVPRPKYSLLQLQEDIYVKYKTYLMFAGKNDSRFDIPFKKAFRRDK
uniref:Protein SCAR n=1 Tax=Leersia perrieri TaxID=77586 RepID=A0A0D9X380_9ORYZ